jgi:hypothetical protein
MGEILLVDAECTKRIVERAVTADELTAVSDFKLAGAAIEQMYSVQLPTSQGHWSSSHII